MMTATTATNSSMNKNTIYTDSSDDIHEQRYQSKSRWYEKSVTQVEKNSVKLL